MIDIPKLIESKRAAYRKLPAVIRGAVVIISFVIGVAGLALALTPPPFFDIGVILLLASLSVLSFQFAWAHATLTYITKKLADKAFRRKLLVFGLLMLLLIVGLGLRRFLA